jgi:ATP phosphoribosyltransferase regulatory subunit
MQTNRWLLPEGVEEILPPEARRIELLRRSVLDLFESWGYEFVIPPLIEYLDSLLVGQGTDLDLQTFKVIDQLSGRMLGIRADLTSQSARIDAHSLKTLGVVRLCYADTALRARPDGLLSSRTPIVVGAEMYGDASGESDAEVICLAAAMLETVGIESFHLELGHMGIFRGLAAAAALDAEVERELFEAMQRKSVSDIDQLLAGGSLRGEVRDMLRALPGLMGEGDVMARANEVLRDAPEPVHFALQELGALAERVLERRPGLEVRYDLAELRGYHYHTGMVFAAYAHDYGEAVARGGRYDEIGSAFGRARPATGFDAHLTVLARGAKGFARSLGIFAQLPDDAGARPAFWGRVDALRARGERVVCALRDDDDARLSGCDRVLVRGEDGWHVQPLEEQD